MNEAFTDRSRPLAIHIDRLAPGGLAPVSEELRRDRSQKGAFRSKVVVDHVEKHHQSAGMGGGIDQRLQLLRPAVGGIRRIEEHTVISPVPPTREVADRHDFDRGDAKLNQMVELGEGSPEGPFRRKGADMHFIEDSLFPGTAPPFEIRPGIGDGVDHLAGP